MPINYKTIKWSWTMEKERTDQRLTAVVGSSIVVNNTQELLDWCKEYLVIDNPDFYKKERMGKWTGGTPQYLYLFETIGYYLVIPFGCFRTLYRIFGDKIEWIPNFHDRGFEIEYGSRIQLYDYQQKAVDAILDKRNGVVVMPCGSGKTQTALEAIAKLGRKTLWLTHTQDLLNQSMARAKSVFDLSQSKYGTITAGRVNIGEAITFATVQTMTKIDLDVYGNMWDVVIVDECQHCCGSPTRVTQFYKVVNALNARYKIGLTATPDRSDGMDTSMYALLGSVIHEVTREEVAHTTCPVEVVKIKTGYSPNYDNVLMSDGTINYAALVDDMVNNKERYNVVLDTIRKIHKNGHSVLVLANRVSYLQKMSNDFNEKYGRSVCISSMGQSKKAKEARKRVLNALNSGELDAVFATYQLAKEGLDVPNLKYVVFATPEKDPTTVIQSVGRVGRKADHKDQGNVIDFVDDFGMYEKWSKKRDSMYKKIDAKIIY